MSQTEKSAEALGLIYEDILKLRLSTMEKAMDEKDLERKEFLYTECGAFKKALDIVASHMGRQGIF